MTRVRIAPGACQLTTELAVTMQDDGRVAVAIDSPCKLVSGWAAGLEPLDPYQFVGRRTAGAAPLPCDTCHASCPLPVAVLKAVEVEAGLALPADVRIEFVPGR